MPSSGRKLASPAGVLLPAVLLLAALALRASTFGDPNVGGDETFYQTVGAAMHHGAVPYVDVWDRKPWGLFFLYYLITAISTAPIAYQLVATLFAAATAWVIAQIAMLWTNRQGAVLAALAYLVLLIPFQGYGGQSPVLYNLFMALAVLLVLRAMPLLRDGRVSWQVPAAMLLAGLAITIKTTALFEAAFLGLWCAALLLRAPRRGAWRAIAAWAALGAGPTLAIAAGYALAGYWPIYWNAMVTSNLSKAPEWTSSAIRLAIMFKQLAPVLVVAVLSLIDLPDERRRFVLLWLLAAFAGVAAVPHFFLHYALPLLVPMCVAAAAFLGRRGIGPLAFAILAWLALADSRVLDFDHARRSRDAFEQLNRAIRDHDDGSALFVFDGPHQLYMMAGKRFPTPLVFTAHLGHLMEKDVSHLSTLDEVQRVLALHPGTVVMAPRPRQGPPNIEVDGLVRRWVHRNCRQVARVSAPDWLNENLVDVWAECRTGR